VFTAGWIRSLSDLDALFRLNESNTHSVISFNGGITWQRIWPIVVPRQSRWLYRHNGSPDFGDPAEGCDFHWRYAGLGIEMSAFSAAQPTTGKPPIIEEFEQWAIQYWVIVLPLSLLSAWLLLSKQQWKQPVPDA